MQAYLDNSASTRPYDEVISLYHELCVSEYANPSARHLMGHNVKKRMDKALKSIGNSIGCKYEDIIITSGGSESNNLAIIGASKASNKRHIITTVFEHSSVSKPIAYLEEKGYEITRLSVDSNGLISLNELETSIRDDTLMVSIIGVNNEMGAIQDINKISDVVRSKNSNTLIHIDGVQLLGKLKLDLSKLDIDSISVSAHKVHCMKGIGLLYVKDKSRLKPIIYGGGQQYGLRAGTDNMPMIASLARALELCYENFDEKYEKLVFYRKKIKEELCKIDGVIINESLEASQAPGIISITVKNVLNEILMRDLENKGIYVSAGSACSNHLKKRQSDTLKAIGLDVSSSDSTIRVSLSFDNTEDEIEYFIKEIKKSIEFLRKFIKK